MIERIKTKLRFSKQGNCASEGVIANQSAVTFLAYQRDLYFNNKINLITGKNEC